MKLLHPANLDPDRDWNEYDIITAHLGWVRAMFQTTWHSSDRESDSFLGGYLEGQGLPVTPETLATLRARMGLRPPNVVPEAGRIQRISPDSASPNTAGIDCRASYSPVIIHVPHAGLSWPDDGTPMPDVADLAGEMTLMADLFADQIAKQVVQTMASRVMNHAAQARWPSLFINRLTRLAIDPERFDDNTEEMNCVGMGVVYERTHDKRPLYRDGLTLDDIGQRKALWYRPYAAALADLVDSTLAREGRCLIIDLHSYSTDPLAYELHQTGERPPVCLGFEPQHDPGIDKAEQIFQDHGVATARNTPFAGSYVPLKHWHKNPAVQSLMVEIRKDQYLDANTPNTSKMDALAAPIADFITAWMRQAT